MVLGFADGGGRGCVGSALFALAVNSVARNPDGAFGVRDVLAGG